MIYWLSGEKMLIGFDSYQGKSKGELLAVVRRYYDRFLDNEVLMDSLKSLMQFDERMEMLRLPMIEQESTIPPVVTKEDDEEREAYKGYAREILL